MTASNFAGYTLDGVHNRTAVTGSVYAGSQIGTYTLDSSNPPGDHQTNQYTETPYDIPGYDENGNLVMLSPQGGVGVLLDFGVQQGSPALESAVGERIAQGDTYADLTNDSQLASDDMAQLVELMEPQGGGGGGGEGGGGENQGPMRLADLRYDYRNQMVEYEDTDLVNLWRFQHDALGRRVSRLGPDGVTAYVNGGQTSWQVLAEFDEVTNSSNLLATYVYGNYIDEPIQMSRDFDPENSTPQQHFFFHQDDLFNVVALTAGVGSAIVPGFVDPVSAGAVVERYRYGDYGSPEFINAGGTALLPASITRNPYLFTGREWDQGIRFYYYRTRYMEPTWGRFTTRDTIGTWGAQGNAGSAFAYVRNRATILIDPFGMEDADPAYFHNMPVDIREPEFGGNSWNFGTPYSTTGKSMMRDAAKKACKRAQCALRTADNEAKDAGVSACMCEARKKLRTPIDENRLKERLESFLSAFCQGAKSPRRFRFGTTDPQNDPHINPPFGTPDRDRWTYYPVFDSRDPAGREGQPRGRQLPNDITHESFHHLFDTPDDPTFGEDLQRDIDHHIDEFAKYSSNIDGSPCLP